MRYVVRMGFRVENVLVIDLHLKSLDCIHGETSDLLNLAQVQRYWGQFQQAVATLDVLNHLEKKTKNANLFYIYTQCVILTAN